jgi:signal transduction histidine kinase
MARSDRDVAVMDWLPVLVLPPVMIADAAITASGKPITVLGVVATFVGTAPLVLRRRLSFPALSPILVAGIVLVLWAVNPGNTVVLIPMVALFELAMRGDRRRSLWMGLAVVPCVLVSILPFADAAELPSLLIRNVALVLLAIAAGDTLRARQESAERGAAAREEETLRRLSEGRLSIAREIHDVVAHAMTAINVQAGVAAHLLERDPQQAHDALRHIKRVSGEALDDMRATLGALREPALAAPVSPAAGLADIARLADDVRAAGVEVTLDIDRVGDVPAPVQSAGYRIVQEALTNVVRHARASATAVCVERGEDAVMIDVSDDGSGPSPDSDPGHGVRGMRERAAALGGSLDVLPSDRGGWRVHARLPLSPRVAEDQT